MLDGSLRFAEPGPNSSTAIPGRRKVWIKCQSAFNQRRSSIQIVRHIRQSVGRRCQCNCIVCAELSSAPCQLGCFVLLSLEISGPTVCYSQTVTSSCHCVSAGEVWINFSCTLEEPQSILVALSG